MSLTIGQRVRFRDFDCPLDQMGVEAGTTGRVWSIEPPEKDGQPTCYWIRLHGGARVRVTEEHVEVTK